MSIEFKISTKPVEYKKALRLLENRVNDVLNQKKPELIWILEHPLIYTSGVRASKQDILSDKIKIISTNRGGKITLHNKGQKIIYFVLNLNNRGKNIRTLITKVENAIIKFLKLYNVQGKADRQNIGIWVKGNKISAIGVRVKKWIAYHGCSINIDNNLDDYKKINPCGLDNNKITSLEKVTTLKIKSINKNLKDCFLKEFI